MKKGKRGFDFNLIGHTYFYNMHFRSYGILIFFGIFGKTWQNRDKIGIQSGKSDFFGIFSIIPSILMFFIILQVFLPLEWFLAILEGVGPISHPIMYNLCTIFYIS